MGLNVETACASIRAGLSRPRPLRSYSTIDADMGEDAKPVMVHAVKGYTEGFYFLGLWKRLAEGCFRDLLRNAEIDANDTSLWRRTVLAFVTSNPDPNRYLLDEDWDPEEIQITYAEPLLETPSGMIRPSEIKLWFGGHAGTAEAVRWAAQQIETAVCDRVVVLATDSCADVLTVEWLAASRRLKTAQNPVGTTPGEASAAFLLESGASAKQRNARVRAWVPACEVGKAVMDGPSFSALGKAYASALLNCMQHGRPGASFVGDVIWDLNGEPWRAHATSYALSAIANSGHRVHSWVVPATSLGEVGAASGAVGVCVAVRAIERNYATGDEIVASLSESGDIGAIVITGAGG